VIAVIFKAELGQLDDEYFLVAKRLRELAETKYGCMRIVSVTENNIELTISYWEHLDQIKRWKTDPEHLQAQIKCRKGWYRSYQIDVTEVLDWFPRENFTDDE